MSWALIIAQLVLQYGPQAAKAIADMLSKVKSPGDLTDADWEKLFALAKTPYSHYVPFPPPNNI